MSSIFIHKINLDKIEKIDEINFTVRKNTSKFYVSMTKNNFIQNIHLIRFLLKYNLQYHFKMNLVRKGQNVSDLELFKYSKAQI